jgi:hypothetical protein
LRYSAITSWPQSFATHREQFLVPSTKLFRHSATKEKCVSKAAFVVLAAGDTHESLGQVVNALMGALEHLESDGEVRIIFDGRRRHPGRGGICEG